MSDTVTLSRAEYDALVKSDRILSALYAGGVDNWEWYGESLQEIWDEDD